MRCRFRCGQTCLGRSADGGTMPSTPSTQELDAELTRMRRTFRVAVIAAAIGATVGAGVVITVVGALYSVVSGPTPETRKAEEAKSERLRTVRTPQPEQAAAGGDDACRDQT